MHIKGGFQYRNYSQYLKVLHDTHHVVESNGWRLGQKPSHNSTMVGPHALWKELYEQAEKQTLEAPPISAEQYSIVHMYQMSFILSSIDGNPGCFQVLAVTNKAAMNIVEQVSLWYGSVFFGYAPEL
ncbi:hypothetical protein H671_2g6492 [Cricetulus griseus]|uniref:Uncharacterized protein n=1 Tax=Cricetulus griseus TaxID=10029 RepID=A0A061ID10_CRIGR|nr:hypothetical protein H671_2g6492 [Cricetulus griseus]